MTKKSNRQSQNSPRNLRLKQQNGVKSILNFLLDCWFCEICDGVSEARMIQWMSLVVVSWKFCRGKKWQERFLCFNCEWSCFCDIASFLRISTQKVYKLMYGDTVTFFSHLIASSRILLPNWVAHFCPSMLHQKKKNYYSYIHIWLQCTFCNISCNR